MITTFSGFKLPDGFVKLRRGSGKDRQGMAVKAKGLQSFNPCVELTLKLFFFYQQT